MKFLDNQTGEYSFYTTTKGLYEHIISNYCECNEGYDVLDKKDGKMKCLNCKNLNNLESLSDKIMLDEIIACDYTPEPETDEEKEILKEYQNNN